MAKATLYPFCKNELPISGFCGFCGKPIFKGSGTLMYMEKYHCAEVSITMTDKYIMLSNNTPYGMGTVGAMSFGLIGGVIGALADTAYSVAKKTYAGFYDLREIECVYYPYPLKRRKTERVVRIVNRDKSDFILMLFKKEAINFTNALRQNGICVIDASNQPVNTVCCQLPFIDRKTFDKRICHSAGSFVKLLKRQYVAAPIVLPKFDGINRRSCPKCGQPAEDGSVFCTYCGTRL